MILRVYIVCMGLSTLPYELSLFFLSRVLIMETRSSKRGYYVDFVERYKAGLAPQGVVKGKNGKQYRL